MNIGILGQPFLLEDAYSFRIANIVHSRIVNGHDTIFPKFEKSPLLEISLAVDEEGDQVVDIYKEWDVYGIKAKSNRNFPIIPIRGVMSRDGNCGWGNQYIGEMIQVLDKDPEVRGIILSIDSPGGTVDSTQYLADIVRNTKKPIVSYVVSSCYSAAYFVASQSDHIIISPEITSGVGSIGVIGTYYNYAKQLEKNGIDWEIFRATKSTKKQSMNSLEPLTDEMRQKTIDEFDSILAVFEKYVKFGRAGKLKSSEVFDAGTYGPEEALSIGLVDEIGSIKNAVLKIKSLS